MKYAITNASTPTAMRMLFLAQLGMPVVVVVVGVVPSAVIRSILREHMLGEWLDALHDHGSRSGTPAEPLGVPLASTRPLHRLGSRLATVES